MFLLNSRQSHFTATLQSLHLRGYPFSRSYGVMLPNSLTRVLPFALVYSTHLPVSVCGTSAVKLCLETFLGNKTQPLMPCGSLSPQLNWRIYLPISTPRWIAPKSNNGLAYLVASSHRTNERFRNIDRMSITYASRPRLRTRLTRRGMTWRRKP